MAKEVKTSKDEKRYVIPAVEKAFAILEFISTDGRALSISEMSRHMKLPVSSTNTLLRSLEYCGYLTRDGRKRGAFRMTGRDSDRYKAVNLIGVTVCNSIPHGTHRGPARLRPSVPGSP